MTKSNDELLQQLIQSGNNVNGLNEFDKDEIQAYKMLFEVLNEKQEEALPGNFSTKVISAIQHKQEKRTIIIVYALMGLLVFSFISLFILAFDYSVFSQILKGIGYNFLLLFIVAISVLVIQLVERRKTINILNQL